MQNVVDVDVDDIAVVCLAEVILVEVGAWNSCALEDALTANGKKANIKKQFQIATKAVNDWNFQNEIIVKTADNNVSVYFHLYLYFYLFGGER